MTLKRLNVSLEIWGENKGKYEVEIEVLENRNEIKMVLPPEMGVALVGQVKDIIHKFSIQAADRLHDELLMAQPQQIEG